MKRTPEAPAAPPPQGGAASGPAKPAPRRLLGPRPFVAKVAAAHPALLLAAVLSSAAAQTPFPEPADARLAAGRTAWLGTCRDCHANSLSDAPQYKDAAAWAPRIARGRDDLYVSALKGRVGANDAQMPARGGNATLKDDEVRAAVDYMLFLVSSRKESK